MEAVKIDIIIPNSESIGVQKLPSPSPVAISRANNLPLTPAQLALLGRAKDCHPNIPDDEKHRRISRSHCLLEINPPDIRIRDFGSKNGTFVNGKKIGQREAHHTPEYAAQIQFPE
jgi:pSer/pThr/pTyr-binding forkhead associated (FHA) protein